MNGMIHGDLLTKADDLVIEAYQRGYEDGQRVDEAERERITTEDINLAYKRGYGEGFKHGQKGLYSLQNLEDQSALSYHNGLNDAWECARKLRHPSYVGGMYDNDKHKVWGYFSSDEILTNYTAQEAIQKLKDYEQSKCDTCKYSESQFNPCNGCEDGSEYEEQQKSLCNTCSNNTDCTTANEIVTGCIAYEERQTKKNCKDAKGEP